MAKTKASTDGTVRLLHGASGAVVTVSEEKAAGLIAGRQFTAEDTARTPGPTAFDPGEHSVDEVKAYLETADEAEAERVLTAERSGKARVSLLG